ncbi:MAG: hypothetical protein KDA65_09555 [Planctomycetaceae bacterium]|nr:hypothetical protein [Planctomycetaceae bacterium]
MSTITPFSCLKSSLWTMTFCACASLILPGTDTFGAEPPEFLNAVEEAKSYLLKAYDNKEIPDDGRMTITALALLKANVPRENPVISNAVRLIQSKTGGEKYKAGEAIKDVYEAGVDLMLLEALDHEGLQYKPQMEVLVDYIIKRQAGNGAWDYTNKEADGGDTSMSQYALLGLWSARKAGVVFSPEVWDKSAQWHLTTQQSDGGFTYHPYRGTPSSHTMTVAGICNLMVIRRHLYPDAAGRWANKAVDKKAEEDKGPAKKFGVLSSAPPEGLETEAAEVEDAESMSEIEKTEREKAIEAIKEYKPRTPLSAIDKSINAAMAWMSRKYSIARGVGNYHLYYLYGIERMCALGNMKQFVGHDWYFEGGQRLVKIQNEELGNWNEVITGKAAATSFGLMFLTKATAQSLGKAPSFGLGAGLLTGARGLKNPNEPEMTPEQQKIAEAKKEEPVDKLLAQLMNPKEPNIDAITGALVHNVNFKDREGLISQKETLLRMANDPRMEVKKIAMWALGRTEDFDVIPVLIDGLLVENVDVNTEALLSLCFLTRKPNGLSDQDVSPDQLIDPTLKGEERYQAVQNWRTETYRRWKKWYFTIRPYSERDDVEEALKIK